MKRLVFLVIMASFLSGCPSKNKSKSPDTFYRNLRIEPKSLDAFSSRLEGVSSTVNGYIFDTLLVRDIETLEYMPALAESFSVSSNGMEFTFVLRSGAVFSDGKPVTVEDIKFSFDALFDDKYKAADIRSYYENIEKAEIIDENTIKFTAKKKYFQNLGVLAGLEIVPKHIYETPDKKFNTMSYGSGPFVLDSFKNGRSIVLKKNPKWWGYNVEYFKPYYNFKKIVYRFIKDEKVALEAFKKGDLDFHSLSAEQFVKHTEGEPWGTKVFKETVNNSAAKSTPFIGWNLLNDLFKSRKVRRALTHLYDRDMLAKKFFYDKAIPATGPWYQQNPAANPDRKPLPFDPKLAKKLLQEEGWADADKNGVLEKNIGGNQREFRFTLLNPNPDYEKYFTVYKEELKKAGIDMKITNLEWNAFQRKTDDQDFDAVFLVWGGQIDVDPKQVWHSDNAKKGRSNFISYKNAEVDHLIDKARLELDREKRHKILRKVYDIIADDAPYVFLTNYKSSFYGYSSRMNRPKPFFKYGVGVDKWSIKAEAN